MKVAIGADQKGFELKEHVKPILIKKGYEIVDFSENPSEDFVDSALAVSKAVAGQEAERGIMFDEYGAGSFMASNKIKGMITANVADENTAKMTRGHNNANAITIGSAIVAKEQAARLALLFLESHYDGGRHQVRVDMLNKML